MGKKQENTGFVCGNCGRKVLLASKSYRNHCPYCLYSRHVDVVPGDRRSDCGGLMKPVGLTYKSGKGHQLVHRCQRCGMQRANIVAEEGVQPDNADILADCAATTPWGDGGI